MKKIVFTSLFVFAGLILNAQTLPFLNFTYSASALAVADTYVARDASGFALEANASSIALSETQYAGSVTYGQLHPSTIASMAVGGGAYARIGSKMGIGIVAKYISDPAYETYSSDGVATGSFKPSDRAFAVGFAYRPLDFLSIALTGRMSTSVIASDAKSMAFSADLSVSCRFEDLSLGFTANNIGPKIKYSGYAYTQPTIFKVGAAYEFFESLTGSLQYEYLLHYGSMAAIGAEYNFLDIVSVKAGYHYGRNETIPCYASVGLGGHFSFVKLDAAYLFASQSLKNTFLITLGVGF